jgi:hypothetical protein
MQKVLEADFARIPALLGAAAGSEATAQLVAASPAVPVAPPEQVGPAVQLGLF